MRRYFTAALLCGSALLGACATVAPERQAGDELVGRSLRVETSGGQVSTLTFAEDGSVRAAFGRNRVTGRWQVRDRQLCFFWTGAERECWRYAAPFPAGRTVTLTSDRGNVVHVTRQ